MVDRIREIALKVLYKVDVEGAYSNLVLDEILKQYRKSVDERDIGLISEIVYGVTTWRLTLDVIVNKYSKLRLKKISPWILNVLRMGIYQIVFLDKIPKSAAVNECVNLAKRYGHRSSSNFVNAILRKVEKSDYEKLFEIEDDLERISKTTSMPVWIVEELLKDIDIKEVEKICANSNLKPKVSIRINNLKTSKQELIKRFENEKICTENGVIDDFLILNKTKNIESLESFKNGLFTVQDEAAGLISIILNPTEKDIVLDACSAPGGKTTYLAEIMKNKGEIEAWDIYEHRLKLVEENAKRLGIKNIVTEAKDATIFDEQYKDKFDKILLDVPCLGIGVLKRKPDIKWRRSKEDLKSIAETQEKILQNCSNYLKKDGEIVYSTCSILSEENEKIIEKFLKKNKNFKLEKIGPTNSGKYFEKFVKKEGYIQVYQNEKTDGFFIAKIRKIG